MKTIFFDLKNWNIKLICLLLALGLYFWVQNEDVEERRLNIPLEILNLPKNLVMASTPPKFTRVVIKGSKKILTSLTSASIRSEIDLLTAQLGNNQSFNVKLKQVDFPDRVEVINFSPKRVTLNLEEIETKKLKLNIIIEGKLKEGYELGKPTVQPEFVMASGPKSVISKLEKVEMEPVSIEGKFSEIRQRVRVMTTDSVVSKTKSAVVRIPVFELTGVKKFTLPIQVEGILDLDKRIKFRISRKSVSIKVKVPSKIKNLKVSDFKAWIDISGTGLDSQGNIVPRAEDIQEISIKYPKNISGLVFLASEPDKVKIFYTVKKEFTKDSKLKKKNIQKHKDKSEKTDGNNPKK